MNLEQLEARLARIEARLEALETIEGRALADTDPPPADYQEIESVFGRFLGQSRDLDDPPIDPVTDGGLSIAEFRAKYADKLEPDP